MSNVRTALMLVAISFSSAVAAQNVALGLTRAQLEDADLVDAQGNEIGDVEYAITDARGRVVALAVEVDRKYPQPDKLVQMPLAELRALPEPGDPGDYNIVTTRTAAQVVALPEIGGSGRR